LIKSLIITFFQRGVLKTTKLRFAVNWSWSGTWQVIQVHFLIIFWFRLCFQNLTANTFNQLWIISHGQFCFKHFLEFDDIQLLLLKYLRQFFNIFRYLFSFTCFFLMNLIQELLDKQLDFAITLIFLIFVFQLTLVFS
jgi:hypothetical protein